MSKPFVEIVAKNFTVQHEDEWREIARLLGTVYQLFQPQHIRFFDGIDHIKEETAHFTFDQWYVAGLLNDLKQKPFSATTDHITFQISQDLSFFDNYRKAFQQLVEAAKDSEVLVQFEAKEKLQEFLLKKNIIEVFFRDQWAGFIAVRKDIYKYFKGYVVFEEILLDEFKGLGLGKTLQRAMINYLKSENDELIYGTIDHRNIPSIKTALSNGRKKVGKYVFCKIDG